jgi:hypothetical protein
MRIGSGDRRHRVDHQRDVLDRHQARHTESDPLPREPELLAQVVAGRPEQLRVHTFRHRVNGHAERGRQLARGPTVGHQRVGVPDVCRVAWIRFTGKVQHHRRTAAPEPRRLVERVRMHDVGRLRPRRDLAPGRPAEPFLVHVQRIHRQAAEAAGALKAVDPVAQVRRADHGGADAANRKANAAERERLAGDDVDLDSERRQLAHPRQVPRFPTAPHHREAPHQHRHAHARTAGRPSTCSRAHSSRHTSAQMRLA